MGANLALISNNLADSDTRHFPGSSRNGLDNRADRYTGPGQEIVLGKTYFKEIVFRDRAKLPAPLLCKKEAGVPLSQVNNLDWPLVDSLKSLFRIGIQG